MKFETGDRLIWVEKKSFLDGWRGKVIEVSRHTVYMEGMYIVQWDNHPIPLCYSATDMEKRGYLEDTPEAAWYTL